MSNRSFTLFLIVGILVLGLSKAGFFPGIELATLLSNDHSLTEEFRFQATSSQWVFGISLLIAALSCLFARRFLSTLEYYVAHGNSTAFSVVLGLIAFVLSLLVQEVLFQGIPHVTDASSHLFQARLLAAGSLSSTVPDCYQHFFQHNLIMGADNQWHTKYFPGHALWLTLGIKGHALHIIMPLAFALSVVLYSLLCSSIFSTMAGRCSGLLLITSPLALLLSGSYMSNGSFLMFAMAGCLCGWAGINAPRDARRSGVFVMLSGAFISMAFLTRPQDLVITAAPMMIMFFLFGEIDLKAKTLRLIPYFILGCIPPAGFFFYWNHELYGSLLATGYNFEASRSLTPVIHDSFGFSDSYTPQQAGSYLVWTMLRFNRAFLGWPCSLVLLPFAFMVVRQDRRMITCLVCALAVVVLHFLFSYYAFEYEARYYFAAVPFLIPITLFGLKRLARMLERPLGGPSEARCFCAALVTGFIFYSACYYFPMYIWPRYSGDYEFASTVVHDTVKDANPGKAIVLIKAEGEDEFRYTSGFIYNDPWLTNRVIYARDLPDMNDCLKSAYPERSFYRFVANRDWTQGELVGVP